MIVFKADGEPIGQLLLSPRMSRLFDDEEGTDHVILEREDTKK